MGTHGPDEGLGMLFCCCLTFCSPAGRPREREEEYEGRKRLALPHVVQLRSQVSLAGGQIVLGQTPPARAALLPLLLAPCLAEEPVFAFHHTADF